MVKPQQIVKEILQYIGKRGIVAGGAIRDIILERRPKDYDIFIFKKKWHEEIVREKGIFDKIPKRVLEPHLYGAETRFEVWDTTLHGEAVQIIYAHAFEQLEKLHLFPFGKDHISADNVVRRFPFTVNMLYVDYKGKIVVLPEAKKAFNRKQIIYSDRDESRHCRPSYIVPYMLNRGFYLAIKLGFVIPQETLDFIFDIGYYEDELSERKWGNREEAYHAPF